MRKSAEPAHLDPTQFWKKSIPAFHRQRAASSGVRVTMCAPIVKSLLHKLNVHLPAQANTMITTKRSSEQQHQQVELRSSAAIDPHGVKI